MVNLTSNSHKLLCGLVLTRAVAVPEQRLLEGHSSVRGGRGGVTEKTGIAEAARGRAMVRQGRVGSVSEGESGFAVARELLPGFPLGSPVLVSASRPFSVCAPALFSLCSLSSCCLPPISTHL